MKKTILTMAVVALAGGGLAMNRLQDPAPKPLAIVSELRNPWTSTQLNNDPDEFQFVIVSDRTGGHRAKIFSRAVEKINLLQPEFVLSVGDLIEGGTAEAGKHNKDWDEFDGYVRKLQMPFFYVPGNHDTGNTLTEGVWEERYGRRYYHFLYRNVLFLCLHTDDKPGPVPCLREKQIAYALEALKANANVRHTIVALHKPIWTAPDLEKCGWATVEKALADRPYTVFCGHVHRFQKFVRQGRNYYQLATTGGSSKLRGVEYGEFDQIAWVTMKKEGPVLAHVLLDAVLPGDLSTPDSTETGGPYTPLPTYPIAGLVTYDGVPPAGAQIVFESEAVGQRRAIRADGLVEADGSFRLSTYKAFDGAPEAEYQVTITWRKPAMAGVGPRGPNMLPAKYADKRTSGLKATVKPGQAEIAFELKSN